MIYLFFFFQNSEKDRKTSHKIWIFSSVFFYQLFGYFDSLFNFFSFMSGKTFNFFLNLRQQHDTSSKTQLANRHAITYIHMHIWPQTLCVCLFVCVCLYKYNFLCIKIWELHKFLYLYHNLSSNAYTSVCIWRLISDNEYICFRLV